MTRSRNAALATIIPTIALTIAIDQASKAWAIKSLQPGASVDFVSGILRFTLTHNTGAAFSLGSGHGTLMGLLATLLVIALAGWTAKRIYSSSPPAILESAGIGLLLGGACGNLIDRALKGRVTDFLDFAFIDFPIFNLADALIDIGIGLILISALMVKKNTP